MTCAPKELLTDKATRIARVLRSKLSPEEMADLVDLLSDDASDLWLFQALEGRQPR